MKPKKPKMNRDVIIVSSASDEYEEDLTQREIDDVMKRKQQLDDGTLPAYVAGVKHLERKCEERIKIAEDNYEKRKNRLERKMSKKKKELVERFELEKTNYKNEMIGKLECELMALEKTKKKSNFSKKGSSFEKLDDLIQEHVEKNDDLEQRGPGKRKRRQVVRFDEDGQWTMPSVREKCPTIESIKRGLTNRERGEDRKNIRADVEKQKRWLKKNKRRRHK